MIRYGLFRFGSLTYAVPLLRMCKIVHCQGGFRLPRLPEAVAEVLIDSGELIPVLKLPAQGLLENETARTVEYKVLAESEAGRIALPAAETCGIVAENKGEISNSVEDLLVGVAGVFKYQGKEYNILDVDLMAISMTE